MIEIIVVVALFAIVAGFGLFVSMDSYRSYNFRSERNLVISLLQKARTESMANINQTPHGVHVDANQYVLFQGSPYSSSNPSNQVFPASSIVSHSGMTEVTFDQLSGNASVTGGNLTIQQAINNSIISINNEGQINWTK